MTLPENTQYCFVVDASYLLYKSYFALKGLSITRTTAAGDLMQAPTGHVKGFLDTVLTLNRFNVPVILVLDSPCPYRKELLPSYKEGRHQGTDIFNPFNDLYDILAICTYLPNVSYLKMKGYEADDLIACYQESCYSATRTVPLIFTSDHDALQHNGTWGIFNSFKTIDGRPTPELWDTQAIVKEKYGFDKSYLSYYWKVFKGDASDRIPILMPRLKTTFIREIVNANYDAPFHDFIRYMQTNHSDLNTRYPDWVDKAKVNYSVIVPKPIPFNQLEVQKVGHNQPDVLLHNYQMDHYCSKFIV